MNIYQLCCQHRGKVVHLYEKSGKVHHGRIVEVENDYVWIDPRVGTAPHGFGYGYPSYGGHAAPGAGYGAHGYGGYAAPAAGYGAGYGRNPYFAPVALAAVGGLALGAAFFW